MGFKSSCYTCSSIASSAIGRKENKFRRCFYPGCDSCKGQDKNKRNKNEERLLPQRVSTVSAVSLAGDTART